MSATIDWVVCELCDRYEEYWTWNDEEPPVHWICGSCSHTQLPLWCPTCEQPLWCATMCPKRMEPCGLEPYYEEERA